MKMSAILESAAILRNDKFRQTNFDRLKTAGKIEKNAKNICDAICIGLMPKVGPNYEYKVLES
jgi:hypothetical protein